MASACPGCLPRRAHHARIVNDPGTGLAEAPALAAFLPALAQRLLGEELELPSVPTVWLGDAAARETRVARAGRLAASPRVRQCAPAVSLRGDGRGEPARHAQPRGRRAVAFRGEHAI